MSDLIVGVGQVNLLLRYAQTLKDKRQMLRSVIQKLRNQGFSVVECAYQDMPKQASVGFVFVGTSTGGVKKALDEGLRLFDGQGEILEKNTDIFDYSSEGPDQLPWDKPEEPE